MEGNAPSITITPHSNYIGKSFVLSGNVSDPDSGVRSIWAAILKDGKEKILIDKQYEDLLSVPLSITIEPKTLGLTEGKAIIRIAVRDYSWRDWNKGNLSYIEKEVIIDTLAPRADILTKHHNVTQGGSGLIIFRVSEPDTVSGVHVGDNFFPGHPGHFTDSNILMAFFTLAHNQGTNTELFVSSTDKAGNASRTGFYYHLRKKKFAKDTIAISDKFLNWKMPEFDLDVSGQKIDKFIKINQELRKKNCEVILNHGKSTVPTLYWKNTFLRLRGSAPRAGFADFRSYRYKGDVIDRQYHMGVDLASLSHSPIPAANSGKVVFNASEGIFGKTVIIDHGFGLFSMYSHLSTIDVQTGQELSRGDIIGRTGTTGLAGGDHLHYGMFIHNTFVNPIEWWDGSWIKNNITSKIKDVKGMY
jgi:murein DD-endopeptidase MepM/ murein hydrolase activator NlpD